MSKCCVTHHNACDCREQAHAAEVSRLQAEVERLRGLVRDAYDEGYIDRDRGSEGWFWSDARKALEESKP